MIGRELLARMARRPMERFSPPTNFWKRYRAELTSVIVIKHATCLRLRGDQTVKLVECAGARGARFNVRARYVVVAVGGLETVRVLGHSGYGNHSGMLGRTYMCHIEAAIGQLQLSPAHRGVQFGVERTNDGIYCRRRFTLRAERQQALGILNAAMRLHHPNIVDPSHHPVLSAMVIAKKLFIPEPGRNFTLIERKALRSRQNDVEVWVRHDRNVVFDTPRLARFGLDWVFRRYLAYRGIPAVALPNAAGIYPLDFIGEQAPNHDSRVWAGQYFASGRSSYWHGQDVAEPERRRCQCSRACASCKKSLRRGFCDISHFRASQPIVDHCGNGAAAGASS